MKIAEIKIEREKKVKREEYTQKNNIANWRSTVTASLIIVDNRSNTKKNVSKFVIVSSLLNASDLESSFCFFSHSRKSLTIYKSSVSSHIIYTHKAHIHTPESCCCSPYPANGRYFAFWVYQSVLLISNAPMDNVNIHTGEQREWSHWMFALIPCSQSTRCSLISERLCVKRIIGLWISVTFSIRKQKYLSWRFFRREQTIDPLKTFATTFGRTLNLEKRKSENGVISEF